MSSTDSTPDRADVAADQRSLRINEPTSLSDRRTARQHIAEQLLADLEDLVQRHRSSAPPSEYADLHTELITAEVSHHLALARSALHRHRPS